MLFSLNTYNFASNISQSPSCYFKLCILYVILLSVQSVQLGLVTEVALFVINCSLCKSISCIPHFPFHSHTSKFGCTDRTVVCCSTLSGLDYRILYPPLSTSAVCATKQTIRSNDKVNKLFKNLFLIATGILITYFYYWRTYMCKLPCDRTMLCLICSLKDAVVGR